MEVIKNLTTLFPMDQGIYHAVLCIIAVCLLPLMSLMIYRIARDIILGYMQLSTQENEEVSKNVDNRI